VSAPRLDRPADGVAMVTFDRPPVNAFDPPSYDAAAELLESLDRDPEARAIVLTGAGERAFSAGTDRGSLSLGGAELDVAFAAARRFFAALAAMRTPLVGAINAPAVGGGAMIAAQCDVLVATPGAHFAVPELTLGYPGGGSHLLMLAPRLVVFRMLLLGEVLTAERALEFGALHEVVEPAGLLPSAIGLAVRIAGLDPEAVTAARAILRDGESDRVLDGYDAEMRAMHRLLDGGSDSKYARASGGEESTP
jgi:enoyl-CoA hydratase/carnithine racemase